jgi:DHA2 family methylenomycin A resistance protein-like MFS transporter
MTDTRASSRPETKSTPSKFASSLTLAAVSLGYGVVQLDVTIVNTALNAIGMSLGGGVSELQWVVSAYTIAFAAFILTAGALGDRIGAKRSSWRALRSLPQRRSPALWHPMPRS